MRYSKLITTASILVSAIAFANTGLMDTKKAEEMGKQIQKESWFKEGANQNHDTKWLKENMAKIKQTNQEARDSKDFAEFSPESVEAGTEQYKHVAQMLANNTHSNLQEILQEHAGLSKEQASHFNPEFADTNKSHYAIFISFSMSDSEIKDALIAAAGAGAQVYLNGLKDGDKNIMDTMNRLNKLAVKIEDKPYTRFNPTAFEQYNVTQVPTILYHEGTTTFTAKGIMNLRWLKGHAIDEVESKDFGSYGPTKPVIEKSLIEELEARMAKFDFEGEKKRTMEGYWKRQKFELLPTAEKNDVWFIDPTVRVTADIKNPRGDYLARAGDVINPLATMTAIQNFLVFDATDVKQLEWATAAVTSPELTGPVMIMTSQISTDKGWEHLEAIRQHFSQEIYMLPKEMISKFKLEGLPVMISPDLERQVFKVEQYKLEGEK